MNYIVSENGVLDLRGAHRYITSQQAFPFDDLDIEIDLERVLHHYDLPATFRSDREREVLRRLLIMHAMRRRARFER